MSQGKINGDLGLKFLDYPECLSHSFLDYSIDVWARKIFHLLISIRRASFFLPSLKPQVHASIFKALRSPVEKIFNIFKLKCPHNY